MTAISLVGIAAGIGIFILMSMKRLPVYLAAIVASVIVAVCSLMDPYTALKDHFMVGASGFFKSYFLLFLASSLFGKVLDVTGCARRIALSLGGLTQKTKNPTFWSVLSLTAFYMILTYIGVSGFVLAFAAISVGKELFSTCDVPWRLYPYGSSGTMVASVIAGNYSTPNIVTTTAFGLPTTAGVSLSLVFAAVYLAVLAFVLKLELKGAKKKGEGFLPSGQGIRDSGFGDGRDDSKLPGTWNAAICLMVPIVIIFTLRLPADLSLFIAIAVCVALNFKRIPQLTVTLTEGLGGGVVPIVNVSATFGVASVIQNTAGFASLADLLSSLPGVLPSVILALGLTISVNNFYSFGSQYVEWMTPLGIDMAVGCRLVTTVVFSGMMPHNPGVVNAIMLTRLDYAAAMKSYMKGTMIPGFCALAVSVLVVSLKLIW